MCGRANARRAAGARWLSSRRGRRRPREGDKERAEQEQLQETDDAGPAARRRHAVQVHVDELLRLLRAQIEAPLAHRLAKGRLRVRRRRGVGLRSLVVITFRLAIIPIIFIEFFFARAAQPHVSGLHDRAHFSALPGRLRSVHSWRLFVKEECSSPVEQLQSGRQQTQDLVQPILHPKTYPTAAVVAAARLLAGLLPGRGSCPYARRGKQQQT